MQPIVSEELDWQRRTDSQFDSAFAQAAGAAEAPPPERAKLARTLVSAQARLGSSLCVKLCVIVAGYLCVRGIDTGRAARALMCAQPVLTCVH